MDIMINDDGECFIARYLHCKNCDTYIAYEKDEERDKFLADPKECPVCKGKDWEDVGTADEEKEEEEDD